MKIVKFVSNLWYIFEYKMDSEVLVNVSRVFGYLVVIGGVFIVDVVEY